MQVTNKSPKVDLDGSRNAGFFMALSHLISSFPSMANLISAAFKSKSVSLMADLVTPRKIQLRYDYFKFFRMQNTKSTERIFSHCRDT